MSHERIREVLSSCAGLSVDASSLPEDADLYRAGMTSHATVNVMLALEDGFDVEFPTQMLQRATFSSIASIRRALAELGAELEA
ncbi:MAG TPA: acyl carrier protein [Acidimicrobiales bacterium]|nr:acyl carrier protein [Acidimicrobiales bacterium]